MEPITAGLGIQACKLMFAGLFLSIGFWMGKKATNKVDEWLFTRSDEFKQFVREQQTKRGEVVGG